MAKTDKESKSAKKHFWKDFKAELKKVIWPTPKQIVNNTATVIGIVLITVVIVFILDLAFDALNTYGINKLRTVIDNNAENEVVDGNIVDGNTIENNLVENVTSNDSTTNSEQNQTNNQENTVQE